MGNEELLEEIARLKSLLAEQEERVRVLESSDHEERIRKLESLQFEERIRKLESLNIEGFISNFGTSIESWNCEQRDSLESKTPPQSSSNAPLTETPIRPGPTVLSMPITPTSDPSNLSIHEQFIATIVPQLPFSGAVNRISTFLSSPINAMGHQIPSPLSAAQTISSLPPMKALSSLTKWMPIRTISSISSSLFTTLTANRLTSTPSKNAEACV
jgi:hypothetical protein